MSEAPYIEFDLSALMSSWMPSSSFPVLPKSAFRAPVGADVTAQPLTAETHAPELRLKRSKRIALELFGNLQIFRFARMRKPTPEGMSGAELESSWSSL